MTNLPLGIDDEVEFQTFFVQLGQSDLLVFYTDSLTESQSPAIQFLGEDGLLNIFQSINTEPVEIQTIGQTVLNQVSQFHACSPADDDESIIVIHHNGNGRKHMGIGDKIDVYAKFFGLKSY